MRNQTVGSTEKAPAATVPPPQTAGDGRLPRAARAVAWLLVGVVLLALPLLLPPFRTYLATVVLVYVIAVVGLNVVMGFSGQISISHAAFMGVGAYTTAVLMGRWELPFPLAALAGVLLATLLGYVVGLPALRIAGHYLALATLAFQLIVQSVIFNWESVTNGPRGIAVPPAVVGVFPLADRNLYYLVLVAALLSLLFVRNVVRSRVGRAWRAIRDKEIAASVFGVDVARFKTLAFGVSAGYAGLAGALFAITVGFLDPGAFNLWESVKQLTMVLFGGLGTLVGPPLGAALLVLAPEFLTPFREHSLLVFYVVLLLVLIFLRGGLASGVSRTAAWVRRRRSGAPPSDAVVTDAAVTAARDRPAPPVERSAEAGSAVGESMLTADGVTVRFGGLIALDGVDLRVRDGEIKGLIGPNGAGKTTLFNVLTRVYPVHAGSVTFAGRDMLRLRPHQVVGAGLARTFQNVEMFRSMTALENVLVGRHHRDACGLWRTGLRLPSARAEERQARDAARAALATLGLERYADTPAESLPLGVQRRLEIARAMVAEPRLLMLDEPASGLTAAEAAALMDDVRRIRAAGVTVLLIEHNMRFVMGLSDSVTVLDHGRVIFDGSPQRAQSDPAVVAAYLGEVES
ncbi:branched-chain amino acid transport system permease protein [Micromonospora echinospora]|uniref:Branched-chain amino acid transport system permease protein n=1 Tax=Micromonospora echinospora TaxID=1877 RepID=A0ABR6MEC9_MICEC|nr:branched-chain amino acid ABC transporter ATP-binding protein/permease [Micromonospora echinospora]MBB5113434.1 branched-chain amino acid transport system permease protein [Micromonospora echinospora]